MGRYQTELDAAFLEVKADWDNIVKESGLTERECIRLGVEKALSFLCDYEIMRNTLVTSGGYNLPPLVKGVEVVVEERNDETAVVIKINKEGLSKCWTH